MRRVLRAFIADDERLARRHLLDLLDEAPDVECVGEAASGAATIRAVEEARPDILFLDIQMPGISGIQVLEALSWQPTVIFTTAHDQYAVTAFELSAVDYLLKPFGRDRLEQALANARRNHIVSHSEPDAFPERIARSMDRPSPISRVFVRERGRIVPINTSDIQRLEAHDDYVMLLTEGRSHLVNLKMRDFEERLDPDRFLRIHRSHIVNLEYVAALEPFENSRFVVRMVDGTTVVASRSRSKAFRRLII